MNLKEIERIAEEQMGMRKEQIQKAREPGWLFYHGLRTARIAGQLSEKLNGEHGDVNGEVVFVGGLFHDIGKGTQPHNETGARRAEQLLSSQCSAEELSEICRIIRYHNQRADSADHSIMVRIVQDADLLDHVGPIVPWLCFYWSGSHNETIHDHIRFVTGDENRKYRSGMRSRLNFKESIRMFDERIQWEDKFLGDFRTFYFEGILPSED